MRRHLAWPIGVPLAVLGALAGHSLGYRVAVPDGHERALLLDESGHGYLADLPLVLGVCGAVVLLGFVAAVRGRRTTAPGWLIALLPPLGFVLQEFVERRAFDGSLEWGTALEPAFLAGLALQVPFSLLAALVARALANLARHVAELIAGAPPPRFRLATPVPAIPLVVDLFRAPILARGYAGRGPPPHHG